jgi:hypothetical protein
MQAANLVIEIQNGQVVAVTSTDHNLQYVVFNHDTRNQNLSAYQPDMCLNPEDMQAHIKELMESQPEKPQDYIKSLTFYDTGSVESAFMLPNGERLSVYLPSETMVGKSIADRYAIILERIEKHRKCAQLEIDSAATPGTINLRKS